MPTPLGVIRSAPAGPPRGSADPPSSGRSRLAICLTTCDPPAACLERQIESIKRQTYDDWTCLISDDNSGQDRLHQLRALVRGDARFQLHAMPDRVGFYRNFERCLGLVPGNCDLVALADHDDCWHRDKLAKLVAALRPGDTLAYSDMNIVGEDLAIRSPTYWTTRLNNYDRLDLMLLANTVTGAASIFRRSLLDDVLPFPSPTADSFHDHWIAVVALALGTLSYVDEPLYDYVQHAGNVIGHAAEAPGAASSTGRATLRRWWDRLKAGEAPDLAFWRAVYLNEVLRLRIVAQTALLRLDGRLDDRKRAILRRFAALDSSPTSLAWLAARSLRNLAGPNHTLFAENRLLRGVVWKALGGPLNRTS